MSVIDRLRALHSEVCHAWRRYNEPSISDGEAEIINIGFLILEYFVEKRTADQDARKRSVELIASELAKYYQRVHSQFDSDADIRIMEVPHNE